MLAERIGTRVEVLIGDDFHLWSDVAVLDRIIVGSLGDMADGDIMAVESDDHRWAAMMLLATRIGRRNGLSREQMIVQFIAEAPDQEWAPADMIAEATARMIRLCWAVWETRGADDVKSREEGTFRGPVPRCDRMV